MVTASAVNQRHKLTLTWLGDAAPDASAPSLSLAAFLDKGGVTRDASIDLRCMAFEPARLAMLAGVLVLLALL